MHHESSGEDIRDACNSIQSDGRAISSSKSCRTYKQYKPSNLDEKFKTGGRDSCDCKEWKVEAESEMTGLSQNVKFITDEIEKVTLVAATRGGSSAFEELEVKRVEKKRKEKGSAAAETVEVETLKNETTDLEPDVRPTKLADENRQYGRS